MPQENEWNRFFDAAKILKLMGINRQVRNVADLGCGYGTFTIPAAKLISGDIYALDIEPELIKTVQQKAAEQKLSNVKAILRDFVKEGSGLRDAGVDFVMLFNILHVEKPIVLLREAYRILSSGGMVGIIHWNYDATTPRGPPMNIRPKPEQCIQWAQVAGFIFERFIDLTPHHYGLVLRK